MSELNKYIYELYFPGAIKASGCEVLKHLANLPELKEREEEKNLKLLRKFTKNYQTRSIR